ncbi:hypothetical protein BDF20DRAFT_903877 [Mycotypha africana]|uniref:uncharacterized protein n=1 Tax=Mycotypha africana TaxID=64632 RepID=UPI002300E0F0|nr:uncharacterized protein BDF20DRAFT_903877 [Mycotypha africana]KAI8990962.1 hypothetical protein BDF20DRAFT_903877 [Mycotypha africana]
MANKFEPPYAVEAAGYQKKEGETPVYRHFLSPDELVGHPPNITTMWEMYLHGYEISKDRPFVGIRHKEEDVFKEYRWETYEQVRPHIENFGKGLLKLGLARQQTLGVYSINRREWTVAEIACYKEALIVVALYDTLGPEAMDYIINQTEMEHIVCSKDKVESILNIKERLPFIKSIISMDEDINDADKEKAQSLGVGLYTFAQIEELGAAVNEASKLPSPEDIATICYTSGTTGVPKGAVLTQANCVASIYSAAYAGDLGSFAHVDENDVYISYLPLAHVFERVVEGLMLFRGAAIGYYTGNPATLMDDIAELKPTVFASVPRLFNRIYDKVLAGVNAKGGVASYLFHMAYNAKKANLDNSVHHWLYDRLVFKAIREKLGGRIRFIISGSAPIAPEVLEFLKICLSATVHEGYGQTENYCSGALTILNDNTTGVVGAPFLCSEFKLVDVPDMNYYSTDIPNPRGELCIRGNAVMKGFYKSPEKTQEAIDVDGWLHTGDIAMIDDAKRIAIIDRLKNIFKLSQGEYIAPEKIESIYQKNELIAQAFVYGESKQSQLVGIFLPDHDPLMHWAAKKPEFASMSFEQLCESPAVNLEVMKELTKFGKEYGLKGFEQVKALHLITEEFSVANELLTPTFKLRRENARSAFKEQIDQMYHTLTHGRAFN